MKILLVLDFDHTLVEDNVDMEIRKLAPGGDVPMEMRDLLKENNWTEFMGAVFHYLYNCGVSAKAMKECVEMLPLAPGMKELFDYVSSSSLYDIIIISDANTVFIEYVLKHYNLHCLVSKVFSNPAKFDKDGCLLIENYHQQDWCSLCTTNLCKGHVLRDYTQQSKSKGISYSKVLYIGDGKNDLCPGLSLNAEDFLLVRKGFSLWEKIQSMSNTTSHFSATVIGWDTGVEIKELLKNIKS